MDEIWLHFIWILVHLYKRNHKTLTIEKNYNKPPFLLQSYADESHNPNYKPNKRSNSSHWCSFKFCVQTIIRFLISFEFIRMQIECIANRVHVFIACSNRMNRKNQCACNFTILRIESVRRREGSSRIVGRLKIHRTIGLIWLAFEICKIHTHMHDGQEIFYDFWLDSSTQNSY